MEKKVYIIAHDKASNWLNSQNGLCSHGMQIQYFFPQWTHASLRSWFIHIWTHNKETILTTAEKKIELSVWGIQTSFSSIFQIYFAENVKQHINEVCLKCSKRLLMLISHSTEFSNINSDSTWAKVWVLDYSSRI